MIIIRTIQNLSYYGECFWYESNFLKIKINSECDIHMHIPVEEINEIIYENKKYKDINEFTKGYVNV